MTTRLGYTLRDKLLITRQIFKTTPTFKIDPAPPFLAVYTMSDASKKESYAGMRDLKNPAQIQEEDIISSDGTLMGKQNRVRAGIATFQNPKALEWVC